MNRRKNRLSWLHYVNRRKCRAYPMYGEDLRAAFDTLSPNNTFQVSFLSKNKTRQQVRRPKEERPTNWLYDGYVNCLTAVESKLDLTLKSWIRTFEQRANEIIDNCQRYSYFCLLLIIFIYVSFVIAVT